MCCALKYCSTKEITITGAKSLQEKTSRYMWLFSFTKCAQILLVPTVRRLYKIKVIIRLI